MTSWWSGEGVVPAPGTVAEVFQNGAQFGGQRPGSGPTVLDYVGAVTWAMSVLPGKGPSMVWVDAKAPGTGRLRWRPCTAR